MHTSSVRIKHHIEQVRYVEAQKTTFCLIHYLRNRSTSAISINVYVFFSHSATVPSGPGPPQCRGLTITFRHTHTHTFGRTPLDEWSAPRTDLYLTAHNTHNRQTSMTLAGFELAIPASERPQAYALDSAATGIDCVWLYRCKSTYRTVSPSTADSWNTLHGNQRVIKHGSLQFAELGMFSPLL